MKEAATKFASEDPECPVQEVFMWVDAALAELMRVPGWSPDQLLFGRQLRPLDSEMLGNVAQHSEETIEGSAAEKGMQRRLLARKCILGAQASRKLRIAQLAASRPFRDWVAGEVACFWREAGTSEKGAGARTKTSKGGFVGPALVLGQTERPDGRGSRKRVVWLIHNKELLAVSPQQLRPATSSEKEYFYLARDGAASGAGTLDLEQLVKDHGQYQDLTQQRPPNAEELAEDEEMQDTYTEAAPVHPMVEPRAEPAADVPATEPARPEPAEPEVPVPMDAEAAPEPDTHQGENIEVPTAAAPNPYNVLDDVPQQMKRSASSSEPLSSAKRVRTGDVVAAMATLEDEVTYAYMQFELRDTDLKKFTRDPHGFMNQVMKKKGRTEVSMRKLDDKTRAEMKKSMWAENDNWMVNKVCEPCYRAEAGGQTMRMRWVLDIKDDGKCKARLVVLGFEDKDLGLLKTQAPTCSRRARNLLNQFVANRGWRLRKGDVKAAFLQGKQTQAARNVCVEPTPELREYLNLGEDQIVRLLKAVYGLCNAPLEWFLCIDEWFKSHGWRAVELEPCLWMLYDVTGKCVGIAAIHVDDLLVAGLEDARDSLFTKTMAELKRDFKWGSWEDTTFIQCGVRYTQFEDGSLACTFVEAAMKVELIDGRFASKAFKGRHGELQTACRAALGSLQFLASQGMFWLSAAVSILQSEVPTATDATVRSINKEIRKAHETAHLPIMWRPQNNTVFATWSDGALKQRANGGAQNGYLVCTADESFLTGERGAVSVISHASGKAKRAVRSTLR